MRTFVAVFIAAFFCFTLPAQSQEIAVNHQNRTVEVSVTEKIQAEADIADVTLGCVSYGETHDQHIAQIWRLQTEWSKLCSKQVCRKLKFEAPEFN